MLTTFFVYSHPGFDNYLLDIIRGVESFLDYQLNVSAVKLSGEFKLLDVSETTFFARGEKPTIVLKEIPDSNLLYPSEMPKNLGETTNDQLGLIIQNVVEDNFVLKVMGLNCFEVSKFSDNAENGNVVLNLSSCVQDGFWYGIDVVMSQDHLVFRLCDESGVIVRDFDAGVGGSVVDELLVVLANCKSDDVVFRNLRFDSFSEDQQYLLGNFERDSFPYLLFFFVFSIFWVEEDYVFR
jgi:hypothetical protein